MPDQFLGLQRTITLVATSARVTLARMEVVPRRLRNTVTSVRNMVALQTPITPMIAASTRQTVVRRDSLVERRSRTIALYSSRKSLRRLRRS
jgi:tellurite resistance protein